MKKIVIYTNQYIHELQETGIFMESEEISPYKTFHFEYTKPHCLTLVHFFQTILLNENPVTKHSKKMRDLALDEVFADMDARIERDWSKMARRWKEINMDGYIRFSLNEYRERINFLLYRVVKNHLVFDAFSISEE